MKTGIKALLVAFGLLIFSAGFGMTKAQEATQQEPVVSQRDRLAEEIATLKKTYRGQLTEYLQAEREFSIAKSQYKQLQTLASIDKVIAESKEVMTSRDQVLQTYFLLLKTSLKEAEGIELSYKNKTLERIEEVDDWLESRKTEIAKTSDRLELNVLADDFIEKSGSLRLLSEQATILLSVGKLQNVFDEIESVEGEVFNEATDSADFSREQRETKRVMEVVDSNLKTIWNEIRKGINDFKALSISSTLIKNLNPVYTGLNKALGFVFEVVGL